MWVVCLKVWVIHGVQVTFCFVLLETWMYICFDQDGTQRFVPFPKVGGFGLLSLILFDYGLLANHGCVCMLLCRPTAASKY